MDADALAPHRRTLAYSEVVPHKLPDPNTKQQGAVEVHAVVALSTTSTTSPLRADPTARINIDILRDTPGSCRALAKRFYSLDLVILYIAKKH